MIRKATKKDVDPIYHLCDTKPFKYDENPPYDKEWIEELIKNKRCVTLVCVKDNKVVGVICGERLECRGMMLWFCSVKREYRNGYVGYQLYKGFEEECKRKNIKWVLTYGFQITEKGLEKLGFITNNNRYKEFFKQIGDNPIF